MWVTGVDTGPNNMGAAFNYNLLYHDFGAFAHNRYYAKRLIYDSISWLFDNDYRTTTNTTLNNAPLNNAPIQYFSDVEAAIQNSTLLTTQQKIDACTYLFTTKDNLYTTYSAGSDLNMRPGTSLPDRMY
jgi:hypothetical protein